MPYRLGAPDEILHEATDPEATEPTERPSRPSPQPPPAQPPQPVAVSAPEGSFFTSRALEVVTLGLLLFGGLAWGVGWLIGVVLLWLSSRWTVPEKLFGTLVWPLGSGGIAWYAFLRFYDLWSVLGFLVIVAAQVAVVVSLWRRSGRRLGATG